MKRVLTTLLKSVCIIALVLCGMDAQAQGNLVTGAVRDAKGEPVIGATVIVKGTATGATSGADGRYSIQAGPDATLEFSFIGYKKQEVPVGTRSVIDVVLEEDALMVDDVVVIGYGTQSRRTITAAVSKVDGEKLAGAPVNSIGDALKGRVGGVRVSSADNQPGNLISPVLNIPAGYDLLLTCKVAIWAAAPDQGMVGICEKNDGFWISKGTLDKIVASTKSYVSLDIPAYTWVEVTAVIPNPGAKANPAFFISTADSWFSGSSVKAGRWYIDDIKLVY